MINSITIVQYSHYSYSLYNERKKCKVRLHVPLVGCACRDNDPIPAAPPATSSVIISSLAFSASNHHRTRFKSSYFQYVTPYLIRHKILQPNSRPNTHANFQEK